MKARKGLLMTESLLPLVTDPTLAFGKWQQRLIDACDDMENLPDTPTETYVRAMRICAADRMLTLEFYDAWRADASLQPEARNIRDMVARGLALLRKAKEKRIVENQGEVRRGSHLDEMIENTLVRLGVLDTICREEKSRNDRCGEVERRYKEFSRMAKGRAA